MTASGRQEAQSWQSSLFAAATHKTMDILIEGNESQSRSGTIWLTSGHMEPTVQHQEVKGQVSNGDHAYNEEQTNLSIVTVDWLRYIV